MIDYKVNRIYTGGQRGAALLFALGALALFMLLSLAFVAESLMDRKIAANRAAKPMAAVLCESAINHVRALLMHYQVDPDTLKDIDSLDEFRSIGNEAAGDPLGKTQVDLDEFLAGTGRDWSNVVLAPVADTYWKYIKADEPAEVDDAGNVTNNSIITGRYAFSVLGDYSGRYPEIAADTNEPVNWGTHEEYMLLGAPGEIFSAEVRNALADDDEYEDMVNKHMSPIPPAFVDGFVPSAWDSVYDASNKPDMIDIWQRFNLARNDWDTLTVDDLLTADVNAHVNRVYGNTWDSDFEDDAAQLLNNKTKSIVALSHIADDPATFADLATRRRQIAANLIDYSDSDDEPTSDIAPADWSKSNVPEYTGNERTLYIDRMGVALNPDISITSSGNNIGIQCTIEKSIMAGLVDMYDVGTDSDAQYEARIDFGDSTEPMVHITLNDGVPLTVYYTCTYQYYQIFMGWRDAVLGTPDVPEEYVASGLGTALLNVDWGADLPASVTIPFQVGDGDYRAAAVAAKEEYAPTVALGDLLNAVVPLRILEKGHLITRNVNIQVVGVKMAFDVDIDVPVDAVTLKRNGENVDFADTGIRFQGNGTIVFDPTQPGNSYRQSLPFVQAVYGFDARQNLNPGDWWMDTAYFAPAKDGNFPHTYVGDSFGFDTDGIFQNAGNGFANGIGTPVGGSTGTVYPFATIHADRNPQNLSASRDYSRDLEDGDNPADLSTAYIANEPMKHFYELGHIHRGAKWETLNISKVPSFNDETRVDDSRFTVASADGLSYEEGDGWLLDCVTIRPMDDDDLRPDEDEEYFTSVKFFDLNAVSDDTADYAVSSPGDRYFRRIFVHTTAMDDDYEEVASTGDISDSDRDDIAGWLNWVDKPHYMNRSEVLAAFDGNNGLIRELLPNLTEKAVEDKVAADIAMRTVADIDAVPEVMRVLIVAQSIRDLGGDDGSAITINGVSALRGRFDDGADEISGEQRAIVTLVRDAFSGKYIVSKVEYLEEYY